MHWIETETMKTGADIIPKKLLCNPLIDSKKGNQKQFLDNE